MCKSAEFFVACGIWAILGASVSGADDPKLSDYFGFLPLEVYKLDTRLNNLLVKDLDGDKTDDVIAPASGRPAPEMRAPRSAGRSPVRRSPVSRLLMCPRAVSRAITSWPM